MRAILRHCRIRLATVLRRPLQAGLLVFSGLCSVIFWPGLTDPSGSGWMGLHVLESQGAAFSMLIMAMYVIGLPMVAMGAVRGSAAQHGRHRAWGIQSHPALPIGARSRLLAEALAALVPIVTVRLTAFATGFVPQRFWLGLESSSSTGVWIVQSTVAGSLVLMLFMLVTGSTSRSIESHWLRSLVFATAIISAMKMGWLETLATSAPTVLALAALTIVFFNGPRETGRQFPSRLARLWPLTDGTASRPPLNPEVRFHRDLWGRPLPAAAVLIGAEALFLITDRSIGLPRLVFFFLSVLVVAWLVAFVTLQPMRSKLAVAGTLCKPGFRPGDFSRALSVLPLRRHVVARAVFVFGLVTAAAIWLFAVGMVVLSSWFETGRAELVDSDGNSLVRLALLMAVLVPALAGFLTSAVHGHRRGAALSGAILLTFPPLGTLLLVKSTSAVTLALVVVLLGAVSLAPAMKHLRRAE
jgi:hypothetical protein